MRIHWLQHVEYETLGCIRPALTRRGDVLSCTRLYADDPLPDPGGIDALIVMGGPMNIYEERIHPWLRRERQWIGDVIRAQCRVLGICLGAQLVADALGAPVTRNAHTEIGWWPVTLSDAGRQSRLLKDVPGRFTAFHWHGDTFAIPDGATALVSSEACAHQAFEYGGRVLALQFHLEVTAADARRWYGHGHPPPAPYVQTADEVLPRYDDFAGNNRLMLKLLDNWLA